MKQYLRHSIVIMACSIGLKCEIFAQQTPIPGNNIPAPGLPPMLSYAYPGLNDMLPQAKYNFVRTKRPDVPIQSWPNSNFNFRQSTNYYDGLGRMLQSVAKEAHADGYDIVQPYVYDEQGKERYKYLPYAAHVLSGPGNFKQDVKSGFSLFYDVSGPIEPPFNKTDYDNSPLAKPIKSYSPGRNWVGSNHGVAVEESYNQNLEVIKWEMNDNAGVLPKFDGHVTAGQLTRTKIIDEDGNITLEYKDKNGKTILKKSLIDIAFASSINHKGFACTYYVYDELDRLRYIIPPKAVDIMDGYWDVDPVDLLCFSYNYDAKGRIIETKIPGKEIKYTIYDKRDRVVMTQDGEQRNKGLWLLSLYDIQNRPIITGITEASQSRQQLQDMVDQEGSWAAPHFMHYVLDYKQFHAYPSSIENTKILAYKYYDDYAHLTSNNFDFDASQYAQELPTSAQPYLISPQHSWATKGMLTGSKVRVLDPGNPTADLWIETVIYYDGEGRSIQTHTTNIKGGTDVTSNIYYFGGMLAKKIIKHNNPAALQVPNAADPAMKNITLVQRTERNLRLGGGNDLVGKVDQKINGGPIFTIAKYDYDHLGRITLKDFPAGLVLYEYNIRGLLTHINAEDHSEIPFKPIFEERISYDSGFVSKLYNGNIAGIIWSGSDARKNAYGYSYDALGRLKHAEYRQLDPNGTNWNKDLKDYTVSAITYDLNGNIKTMKQEGVDPINNVPFHMDDLNYGYDGYSNNLLTVQDNGTQISQLPDFKDRSSSSQEYFYDANGNMIQDENKEVKVTYNTFDYPETVLTPNGTITYVYDATGTLLQKRVIGGSTTEIYDYIGDFVYKNDVLQYISNPEGRARPIADPTTNFSTRFVYDFYIKDHLDNVRSTITAVPINSNYLARHEIATANLEQLVFDNIPNVRDAKPGSINPNDGMAAHLVASDPEKRVGTAIMLRVLPGDKFTIDAKSYYEGDFKENGDVSNGAIIESLTSALLGGNTYAGIPLSELPDNIRTIKTALNSPGLAEVINQIQANNDLPNVPKAHLNYIFFDDMMRIVPGQSGSIQIKPNTTSGWQIVDPTNVCNCTIGGPGGPGFAIFYIDNQSIGKDVWFDDIHIEHYNSKVLDEEHYYPFGLTMNLFTAVTPGIAKNDIKFQGQRHDDDLGLNMYGFKYRMHDPQIGRFWQVDPLSEKYIYNSPYAFSENKVTSHFELEGLEAVSLSDGNTLYGPWSSDLYGNSWADRLSYKNGSTQANISLPQTIRNMVKDVPKTSKGEGVIIQTIVQMYHLNSVWKSVYNQNENGTILTGNKLTATDGIDNLNDFYYNSVHSSRPGAIEAAILVQGHEMMHIGQKRKLDLDGNGYNHTKREFFANYFNLFPNDVKNEKGFFFPESFKNDVIWPENVSPSLRKLWIKDVNRFYKDLNPDDKEKYKSLIDNVESH